MVIVVEGDLRGRRRYLFCVYVGVESSCALLIALAFFVDPFYLVASSTPWLSSFSGNKLTKNVRAPVRFNRCLVSSFRRAYFRALADTSQQHLTNLRFDIFRV